MDRYLCFRDMPAVDPIQISNIYHYCFICYQLTKTMYVGLTGFWRDKKVEIIDKTKVDSTTQKTLMYKFWAN